MTQYDDTNRGVLFRNDRRENDRQPTHTGHINIEGREYWLSAWVKEGQKGKYFSLSAKPKEGAPKQQATAAGAAADYASAKSKPAGAGPAPLDDEIPFAMEWR